MKYSQQAMIGIVLAMVIATPRTPSARSSSHSLCSPLPSLLSSPMQLCVFYIDIDNTHSKDDVQNKKNWIYRQRYTEKTLLPTQGNYRASHLIVDIRDTDSVYATHSRKLKDNVSIIASVNEDGSSWIVREYHIDYSSYQDIINEPKE